MLPAGITNFWGSKIFSFKGRCKKTNKKIFWYESQLEFPSFTILKELYHIVKRLKYCETLLDSKIPIFCQTTKEAYFVF